MLLELDQIAKKYSTSPESVPVLDGITLAVRDGDSLAIVGPSGSGKSTLLHIMGTLDTPDSGKVLINGSDVVGLGEEKLARIRNRQIGFVFQLHYLLPQLSLLENALLPVLPQSDKAKTKQAGERAKELLQLAGLGSLFNRLPHQCSVGECQRVAVVRALINEPGLVLADEPTGSLDQDSAARMAELLSNLNRRFGLALVVVTHSPELAQHMGKIYRLEKGKLLPA